MNPLEDPQFQHMIERLEQLNTNMFAGGLPEEFEGAYIPQNEQFLWAVPRSTAQLLHFLVLLKKPAAILELGTSSGYSTMWMAKAVQTYGGHIHTLENTHPKVIFAQNNFAKLNMTEIITIHEGDADKILSQWNTPVDFVFIDANKKGYKRQLLLIEPHLKNGSLVIADNIGDHEEFTKDYRDYVLNDSKYQTIEMKQDNGLTLSIYTPEA